MRKFSSIHDRNIPWKRILEFGSDVFQKGRTTIDLKDKWRNICKGSPKSKWSFICFISCTCQYTLVLAMPSKLHFYGSYLSFCFLYLKTQVEGNQITRWNIIILNGYNIQAKLFSAHCVGSPDFVVSFTQMCGEEELELPPTMPQGHRIISQYSLSDDYFCGDRWISNGAFILLISYLGNSWFNWIQAV